MHPTKPDKALRCRFGEPWMGPHPLCAQERDRLQSEFDAAVVRGEYSEEGYTPAEQRVRVKRLRQLGRLF